MAGQGGSVKEVAHLLAGAVGGPRASQPKSDSCGQGDFERASGTVGGALQCSGQTLARIGVAIGEEAEQSPTAESRIVNVKAETFAQRLEQRSEG